MYGLTECKRVSYLPPEELGRRPESVGIPMPGTRVFIADRNGEDVGANEVGELVVSGPNVMQGYWNAPEETRLRFRPGKQQGDRLLFTGDLFRRDEHGFLYFVARKDDMIKTKGERVSPKEIENCLSEMNAIVEAAIIGVPDAVFGQAIKAFVVTDGKTDITRDHILRHCQQNLEPFMLPKYVEFVDRFDYTGSGKIDKKRLARR
jgi:acyl-coenzyme A synthetase/AMP-(fatty) acid ligase